jgi:hypothetical protein
MLAFQVSISSADLASRMRDRLNGGSAGTSVVWQRRGQRAIVYLDNTLRARALDGWLLCNVELETEPTGRQRLQFVYFLGTNGESDGLQAASTVNAATLPAAQLADVWGADIQRLLWDAVLDGIEAALAEARRQHPADPVTLEGFLCGPDELRVRLLAGVA